MKTYKYTIVIPHTRYEEEKRTNDYEKAKKASLRGYLVIDNKTGLEAYFE